MRLRDLFKELLAICILTPMLYNFCNANDNWSSALTLPGDTVINSFTNFSMASNSYTFRLYNVSTNTGYSLCIKPYLNDIGNVYYIGCISYTGNDTTTYTQFLQDHTDCTALGNFTSISDNISNTNYSYKCYSGYSAYYISKQSTSSYTKQVYRFLMDYNGMLNAFGGGNCPSCPDCPTCPSQYTSLECQTEYNLIPVSEVTKNYCELNFDLIDPVNCPSGGGCSGSGESIVFSNVYVNNVLYPGGADIYLNVNELLATEISYNSQLMYVDVDFDGDEDYINGIVDINSYRPTSEDFTQIFVGGLVRLFPYIVIALFILFVRKLIRKIFK